LAEFNGHYNYLQQPKRANYATVGNSKCCVKRIAGSKQGKDGCWRSKEEESQKTQAERQEKEEEKQLGRGFGFERI
jgi:hypothetical protein